MEQAYAQALWSMIEGGKKPHEAIDAMKKHLDARGRAALMPKIARAFGRLAAREGRKHTMDLTVARGKDFRAALEEAKQVLVAQGIRETDVCESLDESLIGGWRLEGRGVLVDRSWKSALLSIYNRATQ